MKGKIFDIQRFCIHDGPGIRTTVFFKGCPLRCIWCHNPESQSIRTQLAFYTHKCILCKACEEACSVKAHLFDGFGHFVDRERCTVCGECSRVCSASALELLGRDADVDEIMNEVMRDRVFYSNSGGGLTVSGGEPLMQPQFLIELLSKAKENGLHTAVETCGYASSDVIRSVAAFTDLFLFDIKETDDERHTALTGVAFEPIRQNLLLLNSLGADIVLRCPIIPTVNDRDEHLQAIGRLASQLCGVRDVEVMAYHTLGADKYDALSMENAMRGLPSMTDAQKQFCIEKIRSAMK